MKNILCFLFCIATSTAAFADCACGLTGRPKTEAPKQEQQNATHVESNDSTELPESPVNP